MADKKRKSRGDNKHGREKFTKKSRNFTSKSSSNGQRGERKTHTGPRLPAALRKELDRLNPNLPQSDHDDDEVIDSDDGEVFRNGDVFEVDDEVAEEESKKNHRYDPVENYEYELPERFEDENIRSDDENDDEDEVDDLEHEDEELDSEDGADDDGKRVRMLQAITGMPSEAFEGKKKKKIVVSEAYPESEYNPSRDVLTSDGQISINDLLDPLHGKSEYSKLRKRIQDVEKKGIFVQAPLPKPERERLERSQAYEISKKDVSKWVDLVRRNREAPTIIFDENVDLGFSTIGAIASEFKPRTDFEKAIASVVHDDEVVEAHKKDGARLLELNKISIEEEKDRQNRLAKMRSLLFRHEVKAKHIKKIKSKTYHRLKKKDRLKSASAAGEMDPEAAKELAAKQERKRAEERMTLKHKNRSGWARRIMERGLSKQDEGTRAAISEQLRLHEVLTRKMNSMKDDTSSDDSSAEDDVDLEDSDEDGASKLLSKAKEKTIKLMDQEDEQPESGVLSLPFMVRGLEKRKEAALEEAKLAIQEYENSLTQRDVKGPKSLQENVPSGRRVFGGAQKGLEASKANVRSQSDSDSDSERDLEANEDVGVQNGNSNQASKDVDIDLDVLHEDSETVSVFKSVDEVVKDPGSKTTYDVAIFASGSWKKMKNGNNGAASLDPNTTGNTEVSKPASDNHPEEEGDDSDMDSGGQMIDGMLSSGTKQTYELPSQEELIRRAFAGDDVEDEFEKDKEEVLNEENPGPEKPLLLPGWGQWTDVQKKKGLPSWMVKEQEDAKRKREEAIKKRKDANLKHVIISEKVDKKAEKLQSKTLPYPFTSKEAFEQSIRMPIGPEFNPATTFRALNRPEVVKKAGVIIKPITFEEVNPHERTAEEQKQGGRRRKPKIKHNGHKPGDNAKQKIKN